MERPFKTGVQEQNLRWGGTAVTIFVAAWGYWGLWDSAESTWRSPGHSPTHHGILCNLDNTSWFAWNLRTEFPITLVGPTALPLDDSYAHGTQYAYPVWHNITCATFKFQQITEVLPVQVEFWTLKWHYSWLAIEWNEISRKKCNSHECRHSMIVVASIK